ncbi:hypothetical protein A2U01_0105345 [Trifolium medium]|uniref:Uncharacterized protein n=1 Tax=Trifolium medium TaxID=97028 RepID=A0A392V9Y7_9FABA|nr:hypothetical protein [Trifolium medium]
MTPRTTLVALPIALLLSTVTIPLVVIRLTAILAFPFPIIQSLVITGLGLAILITNSCLGRQSWKIPDF